MIDYLVTATLFAVGCSALDRLRGVDTFVPAAVTKFMYGFWICSYIGFLASSPLWAAFLGGGLFALGSAPGWGNPIGRALAGESESPFEDFQKPFELLQTNVPAALAVRGAIWGVSTLVLVAVAPHSWLWAVPTVAMPVAFTAAPYIAKALVPMDKRWATMEYVRGGLFGVMLGAVGLV